MNEIISLYSNCLHVSPNWDAYGNGTSKSCLMLEVLRTLHRFSGYFTDTEALFLFAIRFCFVFSFQGLLSSF